MQPLAMMACDEQPIRYYLYKGLRDVRYQIHKEHQALVRQAIRDKGIELDLAELLQVREHFEKLDQQVDLLRQKRNKLSKAKDNEGQGDEGLRRELARELNAEIKAKEAELRDLQIHYDQLMLLVPNPVLADVPVGKDDSDNVELYKCGELRQFDFKPKDHYE